MGQEETIRSFAFAKGAQGAAWSAVFALFCIYWLSFIPRLWIGAFKRDVENDNIKVIQIICLFSQESKAYRTNSKGRDGLLLLTVGVTISFAAKATHAAVTALA